MELMASRNPSAPRGELPALVQGHLNGADRETYGAWVYYPWSRRLVHLLPREEFLEVRTDRNRYKITRQEQRELRSFTVGVVGLSVGKSAALTMALEGVGGRFRLADYDELELSNMNRLTAGVHELGLPKTTIAARGMLEIDPYLDIEIFDRGLDDGNLETFLAGEGPLDLLVDECDDLYLKVKLRERARDLGMPVIMDTSDRGMLDVERFDLEPARPIFHGLLPDVKAERLQGLATKDKVPYVLRILGEDHLSPRLMASLVEIQESISTWPQLGSGVTLGGALVTNAARRVLLGQLRASGRYYVDLDRLIQSGAEFEFELATPLADPGGADAPRAFPALQPSTSGSVSREDLETIVTAATYAPSAGNTQPWRFEASRGRVRCFADRGRGANSLDHHGYALFATFGAVAENIVLAAEAMGHRARVELVGEEDLIAEVVFEGGGAKASPLAAQIPLRVTNRRFPLRTEVPQDKLQTLCDVAQESGARLHVLTEDRDLDALGELMAAADRVVFLNSRMHRDTMSEFRWTPQEAQRTRDGLALDTLELSPLDRAGLKVIARPKVIATLSEIGAGQGLGAMSRKWVRSASAMVLLTNTGPAPRSFFDGGRALQRVWLTASAEGVGVHPMTSLPYLFARLDAADDEVLGADERAALARLRDAYEGLFGVDRQMNQILLSRLVMAGPPTAIALRRPIEDVAVFED